MNQEEANEVPKLKPVSYTHLDVYKRQAVHQIMGCDIYSLSHAQHMLFLIMHFVKHFLHGGVGIRQVLDIIMYAERFGTEIDWPHLYAVLEEEHVLTLSENVFAIAVDHLGFDVSRITLPEGIDLSALDYEDLLDDICLLYTSSDINNVRMWIILFLY